MSGFNDSDYKKLFDIIAKTDKERADGMNSSKEQAVKENLSYDRVVSGQIFLGTDPTLISGNIYIENGRIKEIEETKTKSENWIVPRFINAHTHIGDTLIKDPPLGNPINDYSIRRELDALIRPPDGLKHRFLQNLSYETAVNSMEDAICELYLNGISVFADFREEGIEGISALKKAILNAAHGIQPIIFGRPACLYPTASNLTGEIEPMVDMILDEVRKILEQADGIGLSGANDLDEYLISKIASKTKSKGKKVSLHAGEKNKNDIKSALELSPDILIHMTHASSQDLKETADLGTSVTVCIRSNLSTGVGLPPVLEMLAEGICVSIGTDNIMLNSPDMFEEMHLLSKIYGLSDAAVFKMATTNGSDTLGCQFTGSIDVGKKADLMILNAKSSNLKNIQNPLAGFVRRARADDILGII
ncbi:MAG: amidohydrolase family protein [Methanimicrococcus sp.]|nr:amidohydrolase family protein [Methanimicrococcus sp.]